LTATLTESGRARGGSPGRLAGARAWLASNSRAANWTLVAASVVAGALLWEIGGRNTPAVVLAPLSTTLVRLWELASTGQLTVALLESLALFFSGLGSAILVGIPFGLLLARVRLLRVALESYIMMLYATPMVALIPFILSIMGFGFTPKVLVVFLFAFFPILYNTVEGARSLKPELVEVAQSFRTTEWALWRDLLIPYTLPFAMTGIRQGIGRGLVGMVAAEFFLSASGIGRLIMVSERDFDMAGMLAAILLITFLGVMLMGLGRALENRFAAWRGLSR
jgi:ABC-type nitrate/sulfonate/bicarbonate transport system permease component